MITLLTLAAAATEPSSTAPRQRCEPGELTGTHRTLTIGPHRLGQEPPARGYKAVLRTRNGCVTPVTFPAAPRP